ncbi:MAG TPA: fatty acid cis/trans isomerase, partial [Fluviicoccus sp.]|nr:fatty acid cis/trans isomerase [Fluviicoccus sp.]
KYRRKHPREGMPLGVTGLSDSEYALVNQWLVEGARTDNALERRARPEEQVQLQQWEAFLNQRGPRERLMARWLYEHLFLAHLYFSELPDSQFFELVRSHTPPGKPIRIIATAAPNDDPAGPVYYRLRPVQGVIVLKTHITFPLSPALLARTRQQFLDPAWKAGTLPGYDEAARANPFTTFAALPARGRYQFMLDHAEYFVRTFIRGPVCHGQIATDVIRDQFWTVFQSPDSDLYITDPVHRATASPLLGLAGQKDGLLDLAPEWARFKRDRNLYQRLRSAAYAAAEPQGASLDDVWNGDGNNRNALLTIFRHFDSAAVRQGLVGEIPQTLWLMDYPLFERTYYGLVANFNVFGTVSHQAQTRLYFDLIRNGAEINFLRLLPPRVRRTVYDDWYQGSAKLKVWLDYGEPDTGAPTREPYATANPHDELAGRLLTRFAAINARPDPINRCVASADCSRPDAPEFARIADRAMALLAAKTAAQLPVVRLMPELTLLRVRDGQGHREIYSLIRNRAHSNVAFMLGEDWRYQPEKDTLTVYPGVQGSYPNFAFDVPSEELDRFVAALRLAATPEEFRSVASRWGVRRTRADFWEVFHDFTAYMRETEPVEAGLLDMNRWENF